MFGNGLGLNGSYINLTQIKTKADAIKYSIEFTSKNGEVDYVASQELFDFICKNVDLPDSSIDEMSYITEFMNQCIDILKEKRSE